MFMSLHILWDLSPLLVVKYTKCITDLNRIQLNSTELRTQVSNTSKSESVQLQAVCAVY